jgi:hypothetical protein
MRQFTTELSCYWGSVGTNAAGKGECPEHPEPSRRYTNHQLDLLPLSLSLHRTESFSATGGWNTKLWLTNLIEWGVRVTAVYSIHAKRSGLAATLATLLSTSVLHKAQGVSWTCTVLSIRPIRPYVRLGWWAHRAQYQSRLTTYARTHREMPTDGGTVQELFCPCRRICLALANRLDWPCMGMQLQCTREGHMAVPSDLSGLRRASSSVALCIALGSRSGRIQASFMAIPTRCPVACTSAFRD